MYAALDQRLLHGEAPTEVGRRWAEQCLAWVDENARLSQENRDWANRYAVLQGELNQFKWDPLPEKLQRTEQRLAAAVARAQAAEAEVQRLTTHAQQAQAQLNLAQRDQRWAEQKVSDLQRLLARYHLSTVDEAAVRLALSPDDGQLRRPLKHNDEGFAPDSADPSARKPRA